VFGAGGGTSSYLEVEEADVIILWGSNARETHPIFFHHVLKAVHRGARIFVVDPRRTSSAQWADRWLGLDVGTDIPLALSVAREIIHSGLAHETFVERATSGYDEFVACVEPWTLEAAEKETGVPADAIRELAHAYAGAEKAQLCWTLGITEHHNATDNVRALINLALLTGHVGRYGSGLNPLRGQNNVQGGGDMGAIPNKLTGFQDITDDAARTKFERAWETTIQPRHGLHLSQMMEAIDEGEMTSLYVVGENPVQSDADSAAVIRRLRSLDHLVVQDIFLTRTAELADVVLPAAAAWCESEGTVTNSERRVQRTRKALDPPGGARDDIAIIAEIAHRLGHPWPTESAEQIWDEVRSLSPMHAGMSYRLLEERGGIQWPFPDEDGEETPFLHGRLWETDPEHRGAAAPFASVEHELPVDVLDEEFNLRLTTGRRLTDYNTGVQSGGFSSPLRTGASIDMCPEDLESMGFEDGEVVRVSSRRGWVVIRTRSDTSLRRGLAFMTCNFPDEVDTNRLTIEANDPIAGTAEFKATAVKVEKVGDLDDDGLVAGPAVSDLELAGQES
jgi:predicted molibdopterin-dependent oxidoreductase YjgC